MTPYSSILFLPENKLCFKLKEKWEKNKKSLAIEVFEILQAMGSGATCTSLYNYRRDTSEIVIERLGGH